MNVHIAVVGRRQADNLLQVRPGGSRQHWTLVAVRRDGVDLNK